MVEANCKITVSVVCLFAGNSCHHILLKNITCDDIENFKCICQQMMAEERGLA